MTSLNFLRHEYSFKSKLQSILKPNSPENQTNILEDQKSEPKINSFFTVDRFRQFLEKMKLYNLKMISSMFKQYAKIFDKEFRTFFRTKSNIFTKFHGDLEKKLKLNTSKIYSSKNLIFQFLDVSEGSFMDKSLSTIFKKSHQNELLSRNFSSIVSADRKAISESLSLILEYSNSDIEDGPKEFNIADYGMCY